MKYIVENQLGDIDVKEFDDLDAAMEYADNLWTHLAISEQRNREAFFILESVNPDPESENHYDGNVVIDYKKWYAVQANSEDAWDMGSYFHDEAVKMAKEVAKWNDGKAIIETIDVDVCIGEEVIALD